eukprot:2969681-Amphidinium_carterae.1
MNKGATVQLQTCGCVCKSPPLFGLDENEGYGSCSGLDCQDIETKGNRGGTSEGRGKGSRLRHRHSEI